MTTPMNCRRDENQRRVMRQRQWQLKSQNKMQYTNTYYEHKEKSYSSSPVDDWCTPYSYQDDDESRHMQQPNVQHGEEFRHEEDDYTPLQISNSYSYEQSPHSLSPIRPLPVRPKASYASHHQSLGASSLSPINIISPHRQPQSHALHSSDSSNSMMIHHNSSYSVVRNQHLPLIPNSFDTLENDPVLVEDPNAPVVPPATSSACASIDNTNSHDVLCGRGGGTNSQVGNRRFRRLVHDYQPIYLTAKRKESQSLLGTL